MHMQAKHAVQGSQVLVPLSVSAKLHSTVSGFLANILHCCTADSNWKSLAALAASYDVGVRAAEKGFEIHDWFHEFA